MSISRVKQEVFSSFIHESQKLEMTQISINRRMDKQCVVYLYNGILLSNIWENSTDKSSHMAESHRHGAKRLSRSL